MTTRAHPVLRRLTEQDVAFAVRIETSRADLEDHVQDPVARLALQARLKKGDLWAWCGVFVAAQWQGFEGLAYLPRASYASGNDLRADAHVYDPLRAQALHSLNAGLAHRMSQYAEVMRLHAEFERIATLFEP